LQRKDQEGNLPPEFEDSARNAVKEEHALGLNDRQMGEKKGKKDMSPRKNKNSLSLTGEAWVKEHYFAQKQEKFTGFTLNKLGFREKSINLGGEKMVGKNFGGGRI